MAIDARSGGFFVSAARCAANTASSSPNATAESVALAWCRILSSDLCGGYEQEIRWRMERRITFSCREGDVRFFFSLKEVIVKERGPATILLWPRASGECVIDTSARTHTDVARASSPVGALDSCHTTKRMVESATEQENLHSKAPWHTADAPHGICLVRTNVKEILRKFPYGDSLLPLACSPHSSSTRVCAVA